MSLDFQALAVLPLDDNSNRANHIVVVRTDSVTLCLVALFLLDDDAGSFNQNFGRPGRDSGNA